MHCHPHLPLFIFVINTPVSVKNRAATLRHDVSLYFGVGRPVPIVEVELFLPAFGTAT
jgi:hypothetical protein